MCAAKYILSAFVNPQFFSDLHVTHWGESVSPDTARVIIITHAHKPSVRLIIYGMTQCEKKVGGGDQEPWIIDAGL